MGSIPPEVANLVERFTRNRESYKNPAYNEKTAIQRQIDATDRQIDRLVYELYELTDDEVRIVEEATG